MTAATPELSAPLLAALQNLARKKDGEAVDWINIADAQALTGLGLAERARDGWTITAAGASLAKAFEHGRNDDEGVQGQAEEGKGTEG